MRRFSSAVVAAGFLIAMLQGGVPAAHAGVGGTLFYLSLGDSLSQGHQPGRGNTTNGYVDDLWRTYQRLIPTLSLRKLGCIGETTGAMITGINSHCHYNHGSQLNAAVAFLNAHPGQVAFITIDIGANDVFDRCLDQNFLLDRACADDQRPRLLARLTTIVDALGAAVDPSVPIVGMTYYDPLLGLWGLVPGGRALARADQRVWTAFNAGLTTTYAAAGATVANVAATFRMHDSTHFVVVPGRGRLPVNVANTCRWTWFCSPRWGGDPHPNRIGYRKIAHTFDLALQGVLQ